MRFLRLFVMIFLVIVVFFTGGLYAAQTAVPTEGYWYNPDDLTGNIQPVVQDNFDDLDTRATANDSDITTLQTDKADKDGTDNITTTGDITSNKLTVEEIAEPSTPSSGFGDIYAKVDGLLYFKNDAGTEILISGASSIEGTSVLSTGEVGAVKFLREDGDGTCSWQVPTGTGDVVGPAGGVVDDEIMVSDGTTGKLIKGSGATLDSNGLALNPQPDPKISLVDSDSGDSDQTVVRITANATTETAGSVVSDMTGQYKDGGDASGDYTDAWTVDGSENKFKILINSVVNYFTALLNDTSATGTIIADLNAGTTISQWQLVYLDETTEEWFLADADGTGTYPTIGIATEAGTDGNPLRVLKSGIARDDTWSWTVNGVIYLSTTAGTLTQTAPSTTDDCFQPVGRAVSATIVLFDINSISGWGIVE